MNESDSLNQHQISSVIANTLTERGEHLWMTKPQTLEINCTPGLECLSILDFIIIKEIPDDVIQENWNNKYSIINKIGEQIFFAVEINDFYAHCLGSCRSFDIKIIGSNHMEVIHLSSVYACQGCCCPCSLKSLEVFAPLAHPIGSIQQEWSFLKPKFRITNQMGKIIFRINGPWCKNLCSRNVIYQVLTGDDMKIATIAKKLFRDVQGNQKQTYCYEVGFPMDLDVRDKALLLAATILIDVMYYI